MMRRAIAQGASWMILLRVCDRLLGLVSTMVLARLLVPADFGVVAMAMSVIALIELAGSFSFELALIQHPSPTRAHYDTAWTLKVGFALGCALLTAALAPVAARFFNEPRLVPVLVALAVGWVVQGLENVGIVNFRRDMAFSKEFAFMFGRRTVSFVTTLVLAFTLGSYWALVWGQLVGGVVGVLLSYAMEPFRPRLSLAALRSMLSFSWWLFVTNIMLFGITRLQHFVVGRLFGPASLGLYTIASEFARLPATELSGPINRALFPGLARISQDRSELRSVFLDVVAITTSIALPSSIGLAVVAAPMVAVLLGDRWLEVAPLMSVLAISCAVEAIALNNGVVYLAIGRPRLSATASAVKLGALVALALLLVPLKGVIGAALAELGSSVCSAIFSTWMAERALALGWRALWRAIWRPILASLLMAAGVSALLSWITPEFADGTSGKILVLFLAVVSGVLAYTSSLYALWYLAGRPKGAETTLLDRLRELVTMLRTRAGSRA